MISIHLACGNPADTGCILLIFFKSTSSNIKQSKGYDTDRSRLP